MFQLGSRHCAVGLIYRFLSFLTIRVTHTCNELNIFAVGADNNYGWLFKTPSNNRIAQILEQLHLRGLYTQHVLMTNKQIDSLRAFRRIRAEPDPQN